MAVKWTPEQWDAITEKDRNILVAAAAGAGKTAVLVRRVIERITSETNPVDIDRMIIMTFTNAAATEMRERIADAISKCLEEKPDSLAIRRQLALLGRAGISTIHSFCLDVIRENFQVLDIDPGFRIADETEIQLMKMEVLDELFEKQYEQENREFLDLLECYGGSRDDVAIQQMTLGLYEFVRSCPWPRKWLDVMTESMGITPGTDFGETIWGKVLLNAAKFELAGSREMLERAIKVIEKTPGLEGYLEVYKEDMEKIDAISRVFTEKENAIWDEIRAAFERMEFSKLPRTGRDVDSINKDAARQYRDNVKQAINKVKERIIAGSSDENISDLRIVKPHIKHLSLLVAEFMEMYSKKKKGKSVVDFSDLEHFCLEILTNTDEQGHMAPSATALEYRKMYEEILVDEYQDSNLVQEEIINMISGPEGEKPHVFMVGDVKQSIYRFRQARPDLFLKKYDKYPFSKGHTSRKITLAKNFRSSGEVIDTVNHLFERIMSVTAGEMDYDDREALHSGVKYRDDVGEGLLTERKTEIHLVETGDRTGLLPWQAAEEERETGDMETDELHVSAGDGQEEDGEIIDGIQCEARVVAKRIKEITGGDGQGRKYCVFDKASGGYRAVEYRDIAILLRTVQNWADVFSEELSLEGIPVFADTGTGFFKTAEVEVVMSLLRIIDNPLQDIPVLSVLRSPIFSFTEDELAEIRLTDIEGPFFQALEKLAEKGSGETARKAEAFLKKLDTWRRISAYLSTDRLIWRLYDETGYYRMLGSMPMGEQRKANLRILYERARRFEETSYKGIFNFINFVDRLKSSRGDMGSAKILGENENVVRIMSIHKSKGLEFPIVILAGCGKKFNFQDMNRGILLHQELGFGPDVVDAGLRFSRPSAAKQAIQEKLRLESISEEMRILYVAMTRAREKLIITACVNDVAKALEKWGLSGMHLKKPGDYEVLKGRSFLDWIGLAFMREAKDYLMEEGSEMDGRAARRTTAGGHAEKGPEREGQAVEKPAAGWRVKIWEKSDVTRDGHDEKQETGSFDEWLEKLEKLETSKKNLHLWEEVNNRLTWEYEYAEASTVPAKISVTELKRRFNIERPEEADILPKPPMLLVKKPLFLEGKKGLSAAEKGTVLHFVMQHLDYHREDIEEQIIDMTSRDLLTVQQAQSIGVDKIKRYLESELGMRMLASENVNREAPFNIGIPCGELFAKMRNDAACRDEIVLLQGVIDCYFEEQDGLVLVDYKTDRVDKGDIGKMRDKYGLQIRYYAKALEMLTGKRVKERYIYLFSIDRAVSC